MPSQSVRICDLYAWSLSRLAGSPRFEIDWPLEDRDRALPAVRNFVERWGARFSELSSSGFDSQARLRLHPLERPATAKDVADGQAIFTLEPDEGVEAIPLERFPMPARWKTLNDPLLTAPRFGGKPGEPTEYNQEGFIWQAERVPTASGRQVYYGFVGRHCIERVPAE